MENYCKRDSVACIASGSRHVRPQEYLDIQELTKENFLCDLDSGVQDPGQTDLNKALFVISKSTT